MKVWVLCLALVGVVSLDNQKSLRRARVSQCKRPDLECKRNKIVPWKPDNELAPVAFSDGTDAKLRLEIPTDEKETWRGLMGRPEDTLRNAGGDFERGMLFIYGGEECDMSFFMKDTISDLDIIFLNHNMTVVDMVEGTTCCLDTLPCKYSPCGEYVLEARKGWAAEHGIAAGSQLGLKSHDKIEFHAPENSYHFSLC